MIVTAVGLLALDTPKGWVQAGGPGLAFFLPEGADANTAEVWMYIDESPFGPKEDDKDFHSAIQSDIAGFKQHFPNGIVRVENSLDLPRVKQKAEVYTFESGEQHNAFEQTAYIEDLGLRWPGRCRPSVRLPNRMAEASRWAPHPQSEARELLKT